MTIDYRTFTWSLGGYILVLIIASKIAAWMELSFDVGMRMVLLLSVFGSITGLLLDQYYKNQEGEHQ